MKTSDIRIGKKYMLSLGRRGAVAVTITGWAGGFWQSVDTRGRPHCSSTRRLSPCPVTDRDGNLIGYAHEGVVQDVADAMARCERAGQ